MPYIICFSEHQIVTYRGVSIPLKSKSNECCFDRIIFFCISDLTISLKNIREIKTNGIIHTVFVASVASMFKV